MDDGTLNMPIRVKPTEKTPSFEYSPRQGMFHIKGRSVPENSKDFYAPIIEWADKFCNSASIDSYLIINIDLEYFSATSLMYLIKVLRLFEKFKNASINWYYDSPEIKEAGEELSDLVKIKINLINSEI